MHPAQFYNPVDAAPSCCYGEHLFLAGILYTESESLQRSIEVRDHFQEIIHHQHAERSTLGRIGHFRGRPQQYGPVRGGREQCAIPIISKQPGCPGQ